MQLSINQSSINDMPFDDEIYDWTFYYTLLHLQNKRERIQFIGNCDDQLRTDGYMIFSVYQSLQFKGDLLDKA